MAEGYLGYVIAALVILAVVLVVFLLADKFLKQDGSKVTKDKKTDEPAVEKPVEKVPEAPKSPVLQIYNSELADDLNEMLKHTDNSENSRLNIESHLDRESNISRYIHEKKYEGFNFADENAPAEEEDQPMKFTREDYKKFMALSNIDDPK